MVVQSMLRNAVLMGLFAVLGTGLVALTHENTKARIAENQRQALLANLHELVPPGTYDNDIIKDTVNVMQQDLLGTDDPVPVYRARDHGTPVAAVLTPVAPDGYNGDIKLMVAIRYDGTILGVRVLAHNETPGLGDAIEISKTPWVTGFNGRSQTNPQPDKWRVKRDGGVFDQFTGATITPRAVVKAVHNCLKYFVANRQTLFAATTAKGAP
jgi:electron transport complex protein RnfG